MENKLSILRKIIPDELEVLYRRYKLLKGIQFHQPVGRRNISNHLKISEKIVRREVEFLKNEHYLNVSASGMTITKQGKMLINDLEDIINDLEGLNNLQKKVQALLNCQKVIIVAGNADDDPYVKQYIGKAAGQELLTRSQHNSIVALTGGSTVYHVVNSIRETSSLSNLLVVPARGSLRTHVEYQANTLAALLAHKLNADYQLLNIPDNLSRKALESIRKEPEIHGVIDMILIADVLLFGIGNALEMADIRNLSDTVADFLIRRKAVGEALGYYFNKDGESVYTSRSIGIKLEQMLHLSYSIAVAGGANKAHAIISVRELFKKGCLVIDEGAAHEIIRILEH